MTHKKFIVCSDLHGDMQDNNAVSALLKFTGIWKPEIRIFAGDLWDFRPVRTKASDAERSESSELDFKSGMEFLQMFQPTKLLLGNHDDRAYRVAKSGGGWERDYAKSLIEKLDEFARQSRCRVYPYDNRKGVVRIGHLKVLHGFACGLNATRVHAEAYGSCIFGHTHQIQLYALPGLDRRVAHNIGCLCQLSMEYNKSNVSALRQAHGFAYGIVNENTGEYRVWQAEEIGGKWFMPSDIVQL